MGVWCQFFNKELSGCDSTPCMTKVLKSRSARWEEYSTQTSSVRNAEILMIGYRGRFFFHGQDVKRNSTKRKGYGCGRCSVGAPRNDSVGCE